MGTKTTVEQAYFHVSNGGLTFSVIEKVDIRKDCRVYPPDWFERDKVIGESAVELESLPKETRYNRSWKVQVMSRFMGCTTRFEFPLVPLMVRWLIQMLQRLQARMEAPQDKPTDGVEYPFRDTTSCRVMAKDGVPVEEHWPFKPKAYSTGSEDSVPPRDLVKTAK